MVVTKHILVPKHTKLSDAQKEKLFKQYNIFTKHLPKILIDDPAIIGLKVKAGDVISVERESITAGKAIYYRAVIDR